MLISVAIVRVLIEPLPASSSLAFVGALYVADLALVLGLVAAAFIDLEHMTLAEEEANEVAQKRSKRP